LKINTHLSLYIRNICPAETESLLSGKPGIFLEGKILFYSRKSTTSWNFIDVQGKKHTHTHTHTESYSPTFIHPNYL